MDRFECLECTVERHRLLVPVESLERVVELSLSPPPPLAPAWVAGLGVPEGGRPLVVVGLAGAASRGSAKAVLLRAPGFEGAFALAVDDVRAIWSINPEVFVPVAATPWAAPGSWLSAAHDGGERVFQLDPGAVARDLFAPAPQGAAPGTSA